MTTTAVKLIHLLPDGTVWIEWANGWWSLFLKADGTHPNYTESCAARRTTPPPAARASPWL